MALFQVSPVDEGVTLLCIGPMTIRTIVVVNTGSGTINYRLFHHNKHDDANETTAIAWDVPILTGNKDIPVSLTTFAIFVGDGERISVRSNKAFDLTATAYVTLPNET